MSFTSAAKESQCYWVEKAWTGFGKQLVKDSNGQLIQGCCPGIPGIGCFKPGNDSTSFSFLDGDQVNAISWSDSGLKGEIDDAFDQLKSLKYL